MTRLVRTELLKLRLSRLTWGLLAVALAMTVLSVAGAILTAGLPGAFATGSPAFVRSVISAAWTSGTFVLILGILSITGEFRHGTVTATLLVTPRRGRVVAAKMAAGALAGLGFSLVTSAVTLAVALPWLDAKGIDVRLGADVVPVLLGVEAATTIYGMVGVGVGALVRNQVAAVVTALVWTSLLEGVAVMLLPEIGRWPRRRRAGALRHRHALGRHAAPGVGRRPPARGLRTDLRPRGLALRRPQGRHVAA
ncbi:MAG: ABC transporter permease [Actinomycetota bacterium]